MGYNNDNNPYLLTNVNNKTIKYSNNMYPISYGIYDDNDNLINGYSYSFNGNKLSEIYDKTNNRKIMFKYDSSGKRIEKEVYSYLTLYSIITTYYYENDKLIKEVIFNEGSDESRVINYIYDGDMLIGIEYNNKIWYYLKNINGLIIGLVNSDGVVEAKYNYTAYGEIKVFNNSGDEELNSSFIGNINPLRYKGYYYDVETSLYYLNSRYYSPELCRFISPDDVEYLDLESINGLNLYAYCGNDPVNRYDPSGHMALFFIALIAGGIAAGANVFSQMIFEDRTFNEIEWSEVFISGIAGFASGFVPGSNFISLIGQSWISSVVDNSLRALVYGDEFTIGKVVFDAITELAIGAAGMAISYGFNKLTSKITNKIFIKAPNYSKYQHYYRGKGFDYSVEEVYQKMHKHVRYRDKTNAVVDYIADRILDFAGGVF